MRRSGAVRKRAMGLGSGLVAAALVLASCNGGGGGDRLTSAELATRGDAVCAQLDKDVKAAAESFPASLDFTPQQMQELYTKILPLVDKAAASFRKLEPPKDLEGAFDSALEQLDIDRRTLAGATASPEAAQRLFDTGVDPFTATGQKLAAAGIKACRGATPDDTSTTTTTAATPPTT